MNTRRIVARTCLALPTGLLAYAGVLKLADPAALLDALRTYQIFPYGVAVGIALLVPWLEIAAGAATLLPRWRTAGAMLAAGLLCGFIAGIAQAWARGLDLACGCLGGGDVATSTVDYAWLVGRNVLLLAALAVWWRLDGSRPERQDTPRP